MKAVDRSTEFGNNPQMLTFILGFSKNNNFENIVEFNKKYLEIVWVLENHSLVRHATYSAQAFICGDTKSKVPNHT